MVATLSLACGRVKCNGVVAVLNDRWRVALHPVPPQWMLQSRKAKSWNHVRAYCQTREALLRNISEYCGTVDPESLAVVQALPEHIRDKVAT